MTDVPATDAVASAPTEGATRRLATWAAGLSSVDIPAVVLDRAKHLILDGLGCALIGAQLPWSRTAVEAVLAIEGRGDHPVIGWDPRCSRGASSPAASTATRSCGPRWSASRPALGSGRLCTGARCSPGVGTPDRCSARSPRQQRSAT